MSITNDGLSRSGTGCFSCTHMATVGVKGLRISHTLRSVSHTQTRHGVLLTQTWLSWLRRVLECSVVTFANVTDSSVCVGMFALQAARRTSYKCT